MRTVLIIAPAFPPQGGVGAQRPAKFAKYLPEFGWSPVVLSAPVPPKAPLDTALEAEVSHIPVYRADLTRIPGIRDRTVCWLPAAWRALLSLHKQHAIDAIYVTGGPFLSFLLPWRLRRRGGPPYVLDFRDPWTLNPYTRSRTTKGRILHHFFQLAERKTIAGAHKVITVSEMMTQDLAAAYPQEPKSKFATIYNGYDDDDLTDCTPVVTEPGTWNLVYMGTAALPHYPFDAVFLAISDLVRNRPDLAARFRLHLVGHVAEEYRRRIHSLGIASQVKVVGFLPHRWALQALAAGDASLLVIQAPTDSDGARYDVSGKLFHYLQVRKPVLATVPPGGEARRLLERAGLLVDLGLAPAEMSAVLTRMITQENQLKPDLGFVQQFSRRIQAGQLARLLDECLAVHQNGPSP